MKMIITALVLTLSLGALASEIKLYEKSGRYRLHRAIFQVNESLGRAWVEVEIEDFRHSTESEYYIERTQVEGLSYDASTKTVILERDGQLIECGRLVTTRLLMFSYKDVRLNGNCTFSSRRVNVTVDDGYEQRQRTHLQVFLNLN